VQFALSQEKVNVGTDQISFSENDVEKAVIKFTGTDLIIDNNEVNGELYLDANLDLKLRGRDDAIITGNDNVYLATGPNLGITRLFINTEGKVGIGTTSPNSDSNVEIFENTAKRAELRITNASEQFRANSGILLNSTYNASTSELVIKNSDWAKMHIRPNGNFWVERQVSAACFDTRGGCDIVEGFDSNETALSPGDVGVLDGEHLIAMAGQVYVNVTGNVVPGDLLTSSDIPGYAQAVNDFTNSHGAILGKALSANKKEHGSVLVFVNLH